jgi:tripartite-type tricarboxylate transporter receptor subunit TctC
MRAFPFFVLALAVVLAGSAQAEYPDRPIRLIVPQAAGSATDTVARLLQPELAREIGQTVIIDNRPGGALTIGIDLVAKAAPDGYTIGMGPVGALAITRHMVAKLPYDIERDLEPVALVTRRQLLLEAGVPGYEAATWSGVIAPAGLPAAVRDKLNAAINRAIQSQTFKQHFAAIGDEPAGGTPQEYADTIRKDSAKWADVVRRSGARLN